MLTLRGAHVLLRPLERSDADAMRALVPATRASAPWGNVPKPEHVDAYIEKALAMKAVVFATCLPSGELVGCTRFFDLQRWDWPPGADPRPGQDVLDAVEIGYTWLAPHAQRTRVNTEAKLLMLQHAFETWRCFRVQLKTDERNDKSRNAILGIGARFEGIFRSAHPAVDGKPRNTAYYSVLAAEWPEVKSHLQRRLAR